MHSQYNEFTRRIGSLRVGINLYQKDIASLVGVSHQSVKDWENGRSKPTEKNMRKLIEVYLQYKAFSPGHEQEEIEELWAMAKLNAELNKKWLVGISNTQVSSVEQSPKDPLTIDEHKTEESNVQSKQIYTAISETAESYSNRNEFTALGNSPPFGLNEVRELLILHMSDLNLMHQNRRLMLDKIHNIWINGVLKQSLQGTIPIELELGEQPKAVTSPFQALFLPKEHPDGFHILDAYEEAQRKLLILGEPGSGKTTLLLQLTHILLERARKDNEHPIPVIFSLASWAKNPQPITEWLVEDLGNTYQIPSALGQSWIENNHILPLFDGLDEVNPSYYTACIEELNVYLRKLGLVPTVICSRSNDYLNQPKRLLLNSAVVVQPLTKQQIDSYLQDTGNQMEELGKLLSRDPTLGTPLMLHILVMAYKGRTVEDPQTTNTLETQKRAFTTYVIQMFEKRPHYVHYKPKKTIEWLQWLARQLHRHNQNRFYIEFMQIDWLPAYPLRQLYLAFAVGLIYGLLSSVGYSISYLPYLPLHRVIIVCLLIAIFNTLLYVFFNGVIFGVLKSIISKTHDILHYSSKIVKMTRKIMKSLERVIYGILNGLLDGVFVGFLVGPVSGWICGIFSCAFCAALGTLDGEIKCAEHLWWSWRSMLRHSPKFLAGGLLLGLFYGLVTGRAYLFTAKLLPSLFLGLGIGLIVSLIMSIRGGFTDKKPNLQNIVKPNQGIRNSIKYSLLFGVFFGVAFGLLFGLIYYDPILFLILGNGYRSSFPANSGLIYGLSDGFIVAGFFWLLSGGIACIQHTFLRLILWMNGSIPWNYSRFLDYCADLAFLHKVGGGYIFFHNLLQEHVETLDCSQMEQIESTVEKS